MSTHTITTETERAWLARATYASEEAQRRAWAFNHNHMRRQGYTHRRVDPTTTTILGTHLYEREGYPTIVVRVWA